MEMGDFLSYTSCITARVIIKIYHSKWDTFENKKGFFVNN